MGFFQGHIKRQSQDSVPSGSGSRALAFSRLRRAWWSVVKSSWGHTALINDKAPLLNEM